MSTFIPYSVVVATRNRVRELSLSIPLIAGQQPPPVEIVVVDSSDDHEVVRATVAGMIARSRVTGRVIRSAPGASRQRNLGLRSVTAPIVFFPDDDVLWFPGMAAAVMRIYALDPCERIGGVVAAEAYAPPAGVHPVNRQSRGTARAAQWAQRRDRARRIIEDQLAPNPFRTIGRRIWRTWDVPRWLQEENAVLVEWASLGRVSFRTSVARRLLIDDVLGQYPLFEDVDLSFRVMQKNLLLGARHARIFHDASPAARADVYEMGVISILNLAYVTCCYAPPRSRARRQLYRYAMLKMLRYWTAARFSWQDRRVHGAMSAYKNIEPLVRAECKDTRKIYASLRMELLGERTDRQH